MARSTSFAFSLIMTGFQYHRYEGQQRLMESIALDQMEVEGMLLVIEGKLNISTEHSAQVETEHAAGEGLLMSRGESWRIKGIVYPCAYVWVTFFTQTAMESVGAGLASIIEHLGRQVTFDTTTMAPIVQSLAAANRIEGERSIMTHLQAQQQFLSMLLLLKQQTHSPTSLSPSRTPSKVAHREPMQLVQQTVLYMQQKFQHDIRVQHLADSVDLPRWQYLRLFKQATGLRPSDYLTRLRMEEAKKRLRVPGARVWEVAHQVGYEDEQYFNRRFKQVMGISPGSYMRKYSPSQQVRDWRGTVQIIPTRPQRIVYDDASTLGDLLVLGVSPIGANLRGMTEALSTNMQPVQEIGYPVEADKVRELNPDLILLSRNGYAQASRVAEIAPIVGLNEYAPLSQRVLKLGEVLDLRQTAKRWLFNYEERSAKIWESLQSRKGRGDTAVMLYVTRNRHVYVMDRKRGINHLLYHPQGFRLDERISRLRQRCHTYYIEADVEQLLQFAIGQWLFILHDEELDGAEVAKWLGSYSQWAQLEAVQAGQVRIISGRYNNDDALHSEELLDSFADLW